LNPEHTHGTVLALDLGLKRTGVATGDLSIGIAHPLTVIQADSTEARLAALAGLVAEWQPVLLVLGLPAHADGSEHDMTRVARNFARRLESRFTLRFFWWTNAIPARRQNPSCMHAASTAGKTRR